MHAPAGPTQFYRALGFGFRAQGLGSRARAWVLMQGELGPKISRRLGSGLAKVMRCSARPISLSAESWKEPRFRGLGCRVQGLGFRVSGLGTRIQRIVATLLSLLAGQRKT